MGERPVPQTQTKRLIVKRLPEVLAVLELAATARPGSDTKKLPAGRDARLREILDAIDLTVLPRRIEFHTADRHIGSLDVEGGRVMGIDGRTVGEDRDAALAAWAQWFGDVVAPPEDLQLRPVPEPSFSGRFAAGLSANDLRNAVGDAGGTDPRAAHSPPRAGSPPLIVAFHGHARGARQFSLSAPPDALPEAAGEAPVTPLVAEVLRVCPSISQLVGKDFLIHLTTGGQSGAAIAVSEDDGSFGHLDCDDLAAVLAGWRAGDRP